LEEKHWVGSWVFEEMPQREHKIGKGASVGSAEENWERLERCVLGVILLQKPTRCYCNQFSEGREWLFLQWMGSGFFFFFFWESNF
jgi:hypothetical protein